MYIVYSLIKQISAALDILTYTIKMRKYFVWTKLYKKPKNHVYIVRRNNENNNIMSTGYCILYEDSLLILLSLAKYEWYYFISQHY